MPVDRTLAEGLARKLVDLYTELEREIAADLARRLKLGIAAPGWASEKLASINDLRNSLQRMLRRVDAEGGEIAAQQLVLAFTRGGNAALAEIAKAGALTETQLAAIRASMPGAEAINALIWSTVTTLRGTHVRVLRWAEDVYREVVASTLPHTLAGTSTRLSTAQRTLDRFLARGVKGFTDRAGRNWDLASYVEMAIRTGTAQAAVQGHLDRLGAAGIDLVIVSNSPQECHLCLVPGTVVEGPAPTWRTRLEYAGDVVSITTASGKNLTGTPDHAVLTATGWRRLQDVRPGDQVVSHDGQQRYPGVVPDDVQVPALIEEAGKTRAPLLLAGPTRRDLYGDRAYREVHCVPSDRNLLAVEHTAFSEPLSDLAFVLGIGTATSGFGSGNVLLDSFGKWTSSGGLMGRFEHGSPLFGVGLLPAFEHSLAREFGPLLASQVGHVLGNGVMPWSSLDISATQVVADHPTADAEGGAELLRALTGQVTLDEVLSVGRRQFRGHVWDLSTTPAWFVANGIVTHNCRPWEGRILDRSGLGGRRVVEIEHAIIDGKIVQVPVAGSVVEAVAAGLMHPNCRHSLSAYLPGVTKPITNTEDPVGDRERQQLRALERRVRRAKLQAAGALTPGDKARHLAKAREAQAAIRDHIDGASSTLFRQRQREQIGTAR